MKIKIIVEMTAMEGSLVLDHPKQFKQIEIGELKSEHRHKFFKTQISIAKKNTFVNFDLIKKDHSAF